MIRTTEVLNELITPRPRGSLRISRVSHEQYVAMGQAINSYIKKTDMLRGIHACVPAGVDFKKFAWWQIELGYAIVFGDHRQIAVTTCRNISKTWTIMFFIVMRMVLFPGTLVSWVPGGNQKQNVQARGYFNKFVIYSRLKDMRGAKWDANEKQFTNDSRLMFLAPTPESVHSQRATILVFDECQDMEQEVFAESAGQALMGSPLKIFIGVSEADTQMDIAFHSAETSFRMELDSEIGIESGILSREAVDSVVRGGMLTADQIAVLIHTRWVRKSDRRFNPKFISFRDLPPSRWMIGWGIDFNGRRVEHWAVRCERDKDGNLYMTEERQVANYADLLLLPGALFPEDEGFNTGFVQALQRENVEKRKGKRIQPVNWAGNSKSEAVGGVIRLQENEKIYIVTETCPILAKDILKIPFNKRGVPDKDTAEGMGLNPHVVDAMIIAAHAASLPDPIEAKLAFFGERI